MALLLGALAGATDPSNNPAEVERIRAHLAQVERELLAVDVSHLTERQVANRMRHIGVLRGYRERGVFPHNHVVPERTPVFSDEHGTHCAVGHLLAQSGHGELARRIANERNHARVPELVDEPELVTWLEDAGFTIEEAARIQPSYGGQPPASTETDNNYAVVSAVAAGIGGSAIAWNLLTEREGSMWWVPGALGVTVGLTDGLLVLAGLAGNSMGSTPVSGTLIGVNAMIGAASGLLGMQTLSAGRRDRDAASQVGGNGNALLEVAPWTSPHGGNGLRLAIRF